MSDFGGPKGPLRGGAREPREEVGHTRGDGPPADRGSNQEARPRAEAEAGGGGRARGAVQTALNGSTQLR